MKQKTLRAAMRTRVKSRCQLKLTTLGAAKVCFLKENEIARVCEAHFCSVGGIMAKERLRRGYTTGSCAAAAAGAAARMLLSGGRVEEVLLETPKGVILRLDIEDIRRGGGLPESKTGSKIAQGQGTAGEMPGAISGEWVSCAVRKDGGDDPDVTTGMLICARVWRQASPGVTIDGGPGVGRVTRKGLDQPVGAAAINRVPREMIKREAEKACREFGYTGGLQVEIFAPRGEEIAAKTFNPRLGIEGGISILGTSGIVIPMSEEALIASIRVEMRMLLANGGEYLVISPGNYGETFSRQLQGLDLTYAMKCSNYVGETLDMARELGVKGILFIAHIGKFIKVSGGIMNTHSKNSDSRAELLAAQALRAGADAATALELLGTVTTEEGLAILEREGLLKPAMEETVSRAARYLQKRAGEEVQVGLILFSNVYGLLGQSSLAGELTEKINKQKKYRQER